MNNAETYKEKIRELLEGNSDVAYLQGLWAFAFYYQPDKKKGVEQYGRLQNENH